MVPDLEVDDGITIPSAEFQLSYARSGGPGGQHVNTTDSRVRLHFDLVNSPSIPEAVKNRMVQSLRARLTAEGQLVITSDRYRSRLRNIEDVLERLKAFVLDNRHAPKKRRATRPSRSSQRRRMDKKTQRGTIKSNRKKPTRDD